MYINANLKVIFPGIFIIKKVFENIKVYKHLTNKSLPHYNYISFILIIIILFVFFSTFISYLFAFF